METAKFCSKKCFGKWQSKNKRGKNSSRYIDGRTNKEYFCKCGRKINVHTALYGSGECIHCFNKYRIFTTKTLQKMKKSHMGLFKGEKHPLFGTHPSKNTRKKLSKASLEYWQNKEYREKTIQASMLGRSLAPNVPEKELNKLLGNDYKFVGDGKVILGGFNPDFINCNGQKKIVELYGCYWHKCKTCGFGNGKRPIDAGRLKEYKKLGYSTLIVWEHELKDIDKLTNRLMEFNGDKLCKK
jgi:G:T-mismatch repair DNA endonuclease (very short patch repair protein)